MALLEGEGGSIPKTKIYTVYGVDSMRQRVEPSLDIFVIVAG